MNTMVGQHRTWPMVVFTSFSIFTIGGLLLVIYTNGYPIGFAAWVVAVAAGLVWLVRWHAKNTAYLCLKCDHTFTIAPLRDFLSPQLSQKKLLRCLRCGESSWCREIGRSEMNVTNAEKIGETAARKAPKPVKSLYVQFAVVLILYLILWVEIGTIYAKLPPNVLTYPLIGGIFGWGNRSAIFTLPILAAMLPLLHGLFCLYAAGQGYRSMVYPIFTAIVGVAIVTFGVMQYMTLTPVIFP